MKSKKQVLVVCQRFPNDINDKFLKRAQEKKNAKKGLNNGDEMLAFAHHMIAKAAKKLVGDCDIKYLSLGLDNSNFSNNGKGYIHFKGKLESGNEFTTNFIAGNPVLSDLPKGTKEEKHVKESKINYYSLIILTSCPNALIDYKLIHSMLKDDGLLTMSTYPDKIQLTYQYRNKVYDIKNYDKFGLFVRVPEKEDLGMFVLRKTSFKSSKTTKSKRRLSKKTKSKRRTTKKLSKKTKKKSDSIL